MKFFIAILVLLVLLVAPAAATSLHQLNYLKGVSSGGELNAPTIELSLDIKKGLEGRAVYFSQTSRYIILTLPNTYIDPAKRTFKSAHPAVAQIMAAQNDKDTTNIKIELAEGVQIDQYAIRDWQEDGKLFLTFPAGKVGANSDEDEPLNIVESPEKSGDELIVVSNSQEEKGQNNNSSKPFEKKINDLFSIPGIAEKKSFDQGGTEGEQTDKPFEQALTASVEEDAALADSTDEKSKLDQIFGSGSDKKKTVEEDDETLPTLSRSAVKMFASLAIVAGLILLISYAIKKFKLGGSRFGFADEYIKVLGTHNLGLKRSLMVIEVQGEVIVLSVSGSDVHFLTKVAKKDALGGNQNATVDSIEPTGFMDHLRHFQENDLQASMSDNFSTAKPMTAGPEPIGDSRAIDSIRKRLASLKPL